MKVSHNEPGGNHQTWQVEDDFDNANCDAIINFNVLGKPSPPPGAQVPGFVSRCSTPTCTMETTGR